MDDEQAIREVGQEILNLKGYKVLLAKTGEEALEIYQQAKAEIDLILLDISMPGMGGHKTLTALLEFDPEAKVIIASGYSLNGQLKDIIESGASDFVAKPFLSKDLLRAVRTVLDGTSD